MYRSVSTNRFHDDHSSYYSSSSPKVPTALRALSQAATNELPMYEPLSETAKKEKTRPKFAERAVHAIPFVLLLCAFILWIFSNPGIDVKGSSISEQIQEIASKVDLDSDGTGHLPVQLEDFQDPGKIRESNIIFQQNR